jgi:hypothetical protein
MNEQEVPRNEPSAEPSAGCYREEKQKDRELVLALFREFLKSEQERQERNSVEPGTAMTRPAHEPRTIHYTELPPPQPHSQLAQEWNCYRREVAKLLAEGHKGRFVLIKGDDLIGIWDTEEEAEAVAHQHYFKQPCLIHPIRSREPLVRLSPRLQRWLR